MATKIPARTPKFLKDYKPPAYLIPEIELDFELEPAATLVRAKLKIEPNPEVNRGSALILNGIGLQLLSIYLDERELSSTEYTIQNGELIIAQPPAKRFIIETQVKIDPAANTSLEGMYISNGMFCTQCEPEGFRQITYFSDRPDIMSRYLVLITADPAHYPVLLSNGNRIKTETLPDGRHKVSYQDPFAKPAYLFALVAGTLTKIQNTFTTKSGRKIALELYTDPGNENLCEFAMQALIDAMHWDEETFALEYDLDTYMIVAVEDFNMGAMENKGLNIFNSKLVLADRRTATDETFEFIQAVVAHEYFHNWTGNRVTCRDWFQLTLKEGLTVYRDQRFTADMTSAAVKRIKDVNHLRNSQFSEDAGPLAHPIQPASYLEMNNFYTMTVYEKGAEVIRMIATMIGKTAFARGIAKYFELYDGQAITINEFLHAMQLASGFDLEQFKLWYHQAGTPEVNIKSEYDPANGILTIHMEQTNAIAKQLGKEEALLIPLQVGLLDIDGNSLPLIPINSDTNTPNMIKQNDKEYLLLLKQKNQSFQFQKIENKPVLSLLRNFSAPIKLRYKQDGPELALRLAHDPDLFNRWEAGQLLMRANLTSIEDDLYTARTPTVDRLLSDAIANLLQDRVDPMFRALALCLPEASELLSEQMPMRIESTLAASDFLGDHLAHMHIDQWQQVYAQNTNDASRSDRAGIAARKLRNQCLWYLARTADGPKLCYLQLQQADNMTDELSALMLLSRHANPYREDALALFEKRWAENNLVMDHWFSAQALSEADDTLDRIAQLQEHNAFRWTNPNKVRALLGALARNISQFHRADGRGYRLLAGAIIRLDPINAGIAARLARVFVRLPRLDQKRQILAQTAVEEILKTSGLSNDVYEILTSIP